MFMMSPMIFTVQGLGVLNNLGDLNLVPSKLESISHQLCIIWVNKKSPSSDHRRDVDSTFHTEQKSLVCSASLTEAQSDLLPVALSVQYVHDQFKAAVHFFMSGWCPVWIVKRDALEVFPWVLDCMSVAVLAHSCLNPVSMHLLSVAPLAGWKR